MTFPLTWAMRSVGFECPATDHYKELRRNILIQSVARDRNDRNFFPAFAGGMTSASLLRLQHRVRISHADVHATSGGTARA